MGKAKHSIEPVFEINFDTGMTNERDESAVERSARLKRWAAKRRSRILRRFQTEGQADLIRLIDNALYHAIGKGIGYPLHFTIKFILREDGFRDTTQTQRFTLVDALTLHNLFTGEKIWMKELKTRSTDEGFNLAFPVREVLFHNQKTRSIMPKKV